MIICKRPVSQTEGGEKGEGGENGEDEGRLLWTDRTDDMEGDPRGHKKSLHSLSLDHYLNSHKVSMGAFLLKPSVEQSVFPTS